MWYSHQAPQLRGPAWIVTCISKTISACTQKLKLLDQDVFIRGSDCCNCPHPITLMPTSLLDETWSHWNYHPGKVKENFPYLLNIPLFAESPSGFPTLHSSFLFFLLFQILLKHLSLFSKLLLLLSPLPPSTKFLNLSPHFQQLSTLDKVFL